MKLTLTYVTRALIVFVAPAVLACATDPGDGSGQAELRLLHASATLPAVEVEVGSERVIQGVPYGQASDIVRVEAGTRRIVVRAGGTVVGELNASLSASHVNTLVVAAGSVQLSAPVLPDTGAIAPDRANIRMVNVVGTNATPPTQLEAKARVPGTDPDSVLTFGVDARVSRYGSLMYFDPGTFRFTYHPTGEATVLADITFAVALGETKAVVLEREAAGNYRVHVITEH